MTDILTALQADAEQLAASYNYNVDRLKYEWDRRSFGSFSRTLDGSREQRDRFRRAWSIAVERAGKAEAA